MSDEFVKHTGMHVRSIVELNTGINDFVITSRHSHSIVPGAFEVTSYATRLIPCTSLMMRGGDASR
jgi:hypothetical protein